MACEKFEDYNPQEKASNLLTEVVKIVDSYATMGLELTCRQVHYQLVSKNITPNTQKSYNTLTSLISRARMAGMLDWSAIVDRNRETQMPYYNDSISEAVDSMLLVYRRNHMQFQEVYIEVMIEKMAIFDIVAQVTRKYSIPLTGDKGFCSNTVLYDVAQRMKEAKARGKACYILYIGDHDPSGLTMDTCIQKSMSTMRANGVGFIRVALTKEQIEEYNLPPNKVKEGDKNADKYKEEHGGASWECDALPPEVLQEILEDEILSLINYETYELVLWAEAEDKRKLTEMVTKLTVEA